MSNATRQPGGKVEPRAAPRLVRLRRLAHAIARRIRRFVRVAHLRLVARRKVVRGGFPFSWYTVRKYLEMLPALIFLIFIGYSVYSIVEGRKGVIERRCSDAGGACGVVLGFVSPFLSLALATTAFLLYRYWKIRRPIVRKAKHRPSELVTTAGKGVEQVVGRRELCTVISHVLRDRRNRRPCLLVGSVGAGKTAVLVQLTQMLAENGRVPIPVRLRDVGTDGAKLDFRELAQQRFYEEADPGGLLSGEQCAKVWRQLCSDGRAVVLADGLEEALTSDDQKRDRDNAIRRAIQRAERQKLPLVIASRPHAPLEETQASIIDLEPLSEEAALDYLTSDDPDPDSHRLDWIVETAVVSESPLYMQLARQLRRHHLLEHIERGKIWDQLDTRSGDSSTLRLRLLEAWEKALVKGHLREEVALPEDERKKTVETIAILATIGLLQDRLEVGFNELTKPSEELAGPVGVLQKKLSALLDMDLGRCQSLLALYASRGEQLGLVESLGDRIRFPHSIIQAYLGSRYLGEVPDGLDTSLRGDRLGRELLIALVLRSCADERSATDETARKLLKAANRRKDAKALDLYAAALEVDLHAQQFMPDRPVSIHGKIANNLRGSWSDIMSGDRRTLDEARGRLIHRFGEVLREISRLADAKEWPVASGEPAYKQFFKLATQEPSYALRLAIAQEIGAGGDTAFDMLRELFRSERRTEGDDPVEQYKQVMEEHRTLERLHSDATIRPGPDLADRRAQYPSNVQKVEELRREKWREYATRAWLVPMIVGSVGVERRGEAKERLSLWLKHLDPAMSPSGRADLPLSFEIALAQGFKSAANRRRRHPDTNNEAREYLVEQAETMLARARFWFSQLTLIHALCLWELPDHTGRTPPGENRSSGSVRWRHPKADPQDAVERWLRMAGSDRAAVDRRVEDQGRKGERLHPFVARAARLAVLALETGRPEQYIWIDEKGAMENVGSCPGDPQFYRKHNLWIPSSVGWTTLDPRAQQLLADVLLLINLTERNGEPEELDTRLERANRNSLPPCLTKDRRPLQPERTIGMAEVAEPGNTCLRDCPFELCPYPPKGERPRAELREVFCRQQEALLGSHRGWIPVLGRRRAPWQGMTCKELRRFWAAMAVRTHTPRS
ncbi:hypothetical protein GCM10010193_26970 [Kitasatospora atroaurantiaca]|uniref:NACHT domain-containing protein n=1 Tax=Kitasatospora atroaurantiaca TaxID=285545 RepID=A0A561EK56_9ACTN|nr:NACHT domain-containing protein [Kitasatospora atroaurantiaca]TWE15980.1 NACHT domain-containing protein [Kitasatospora atroaurantiaca]